MKFIEQIYSIAKAATPESLKKSVANCHVEGLFSLVIDATENGELTRVFFAENEIKPFDVQFHTHCYDLDITVLKGQFVHHEAFELSNETFMPHYKYRSPLNGGAGLEYLGDLSVHISSTDVPAGSMLSLRHDEFHTVSCSAGVVWVVQEKGFQSGESEVLGVPFQTDGLYTEPQQFQVNDKHQQLLKILRAMLLPHRELVMDEEGL